MWTVGGALLFFRCMMPTMVSLANKSESGREAQLQATLNTIPAHTWYALPSGVLTFVSDRTADYLGLPKDHPLRFGTDIGASWDSHIPLLHPDDQEEARRVWSTCLRTARAGELSFRVRNAEGGYRWFLSRAEPLRASDGTLLYWIGVNLEIEERKQAEFYLAEGERLAHMGSWVLDPADFFSYWSHELFHIYGLDPAKEAPSLEEYLAIVHPQDREFMRSLINRMFTEASGCDVTKRIVRPIGEVRYVRCVAVPIVENGVLKRIVGTAMDVTEHEQLAHELQRRQAYLAEAQRLSHTGSFGWNVETGEIVWSDETFRIFEFDPSVKPTLELILERLHPEDRPRSQQIIDQAPGGPDFEVEYRLLMRDGRVKHLHVLARALQNSSGDFEFVGAVTDVTEAKETEHRIHRTINTVPGLHWSARPDGWVDFINQRWLDYTGMKLEQAVGSGWTRAYHPDEIEEVQVMWRTALAERKPLEMEARLRRFDGEYRWFLERVFPLFDHAGQIVGWYGSDIDIHDRKQAEEALRQQEIELRQMLDFTPQFVSVYGPGRERIHANRIQLDYLGVGLDEWRQRGPGIHIHPDDSERLKACWDRALGSGSGFDVELRVRKHDGSYRWFLARYNPVRDDKGQVMRWYVAGTDIEDRKQAEEKLQQENAALREEIDQTSMFEEIVGTSSALKNLLSRVSKVAPSDSTVLITGETGTGKELVARAIHRRSRRSSRAFVSVNCAAIPRDLIASELFGHEKGAFTGATQRRLGRFELADGGTIFLDEIGELLPDTQVALLRVLQEREFERIGGRQAVHVDVRVITATNRVLNAAVANGTFRQDLFYRLNVFPIEVPPLRERKDDILMLVEYFVQRFATKGGKSVRLIDNKTLDLLQSYAWPGNIRELQNVIERSVILSSGEVLSVDELWLSKETALPAYRVKVQPTVRGEVEPRSEREIIEAALAQTKGRVSGPSGAAVKLGIPSSTLATRIKALKINKGQFKFR